MTFDSPLWKWVLFNSFLLGMLALDLGVFRKRSQEVSMKEALGWSAFWISLALIFCGGIWYYDSHQKGIEFLTGYLVEYSLSVDNIFVFILVFSYFKVPPAYRHKVLFWGIMGALVMRLIMIVAGVALIQRFEWIVYIFGAFLIFTGIKMALQKEGDIDPGSNPLVRLLRRAMPVTPEYRGDHFTVMENGKRHATPLLAVLLVIETTDLIFATDSIPAILAISQDPFIVYTSNAFAILGLRSLYFAVAGLMDLFHYLKYALSGILTFVGIKMLLAHSPYKVPTVAALGVIIGFLGLAIILSLMFPKKDEHLEEAIREAGEPADEPAPGEAKPPADVRDEIGA